MKKLILTLAAAMLVASQALAAHPLEATKNLPIVPQPSHIVAGGKALTLDKTIKVNIASRNDADADAILTLTEYNPMLEAYSLSSRKTNAIARGGITVARPGDNRDVDNRLAKANLKVDTTNAEAYALLADSTGVIISGASDAGVFYGIQTLRQLIYADAQGHMQVRAVAISDAPSLKYRWIQDDWARGPIPNMEFVKQQIRTMAEYKLNGYCIYAENNFQSSQYPEINLYGGSVSNDELKEIVDYARRYHVEVIPQQEALGHMHYALRQPRLRHLGERIGGQVLSPAQEGTYSFLSGYFDDFMPCFTSNWFHIGCDEAFELGLGQSAEAAKATSVTDVFVKHLNRLCSMPQLADKKVLFWAEFVRTNPDFDLKKLPKNIVAVTWEYLPLEKYDDYLPPYEKAGIPFMVGPGAFWGGQLFPDYYRNMLNIRNLVREGKRHGTIGMFNTTWDDLGEDFFDEGWYGILYSAAAAWQQEEEASLEQFKDAFDWAFYRNTGHEFTQAIDSVASCHRLMDRMIQSDWVYNNPFADPSLINMMVNNPNFDVAASRCGSATALLYSGLKKAQLHQSTIPALQLGAKRMGFVFTKNQLALDAAERYQAYLADDDKDRTVNTSVYDLIMPYASKMGSLRDLTKELETWHHDLYMHENRPFHWEVIQARYDALQRAWNDQNGLLGSGFARHLPLEQTGFNFQLRSAKSDK